ncbi:hypothetical protein DLM_1486 [Aquitalea magnusonii]|uniref:Uncharacterized protein n=1 Tax=Aquitalea magnusonii TaxID=332411 RepID=A0A3G9GCC6_9NEIS|nr:hypothetical protein DLM_1486 [Aquitalea magnusonii]
MQSRKAPASALAIFCATHPAAAKSISANRTVFQLDGRGEL